MKIQKYILIGTLILVLAGACNDGIDPISYVAPGEDETAPAVTINYPGEGALIRVREDVTSVNIQFEVTDDIEIESVTISLDGSQITSFSDFKDYRRLLGEYLHPTLTNGTHTLTVAATDLSGKNSSKSVTFEKVEPYRPIYDGEVFYMPFDGDYMELISITNATKVGSPGFAGTGVQGTNAYAGATDAYLTFPTAGLLSTGFSAVFWYKLKLTQPRPSYGHRAGILVIGPPDTGKADNLQNNRTSGFRFFREGDDDGLSQTFKLNVGNGTADSWFDGGVTASLNPAVATGWVHMAFTISGTACAVYINGMPVSQGSFTGVNWTGCDILSIASGAPRFTEWTHYSDQSSIDELRLFNKALTQAEIQAIIDNEN
ncbi:MAG: LamG-like jellyroll fold domain-containing protein [Mangrovibacterium sp.]